MEREKAVAIIDNIFMLYEKYGEADYIEEPVSQLEHMCQAAELAEEEEYDDETILAAFFHDIGHLAEFIMPVEQMDGVGVVDHEKIGADFLREKDFPKKFASWCKAMWRQSAISLINILTIIKSFHPQARSLFLTRAV